MLFSVSFFFRPLFLVSTFFLFPLLLIVSTLFFHLALPIMIRPEVAAAIMVPVLAIHAIFPVPV